MAEVAALRMDVVRDVLFSDWNPDCAQWQIEDGRLDVDGYYKHFCERTGSRPDRARLERAAGDIFWPLESSVALVHQLKAAGYRIGLLSNINPLHWQFVSDGRYPWLQRPGENGSLFDVTILSYEAGSMKPDARIYEAAVREAGVAPRDAFFVDDRDENVRGALEAEMDAVQFVGIDQLRADLAARGVRGV
jgi:glucose-1-phosphatase